MYSLKPIDIPPVTNRCKLHYRLQLSCEGMLGKHTASFCGDTHKQDEKIVVFQEISSVPLPWQPTTTYSPRIAAFEAPNNQPIRVPDSRHMAVDRVVLNDFEFHSLHSNGTEAKRRSLDTCGGHGIIIFFFTTSKSAEMFNSNFRDLDEDPFLSDPFRAHREHMRQMMRSFSEPFGGPIMPSIMDGRSRGHDMAEYPSSSVGLRDEHRDMMRNPFSMFDNIMSNMRNRMQEMHQNSENMPTDSNTHSFSSSSVMTYSKVGNEPPKVFQATTSTRRAPGGIKETRRAVKDSESGLEKMSIGHHIQDKGHVVEKKYNKKTGEKEFIQDFQNMDESEAQSFDDEWQQKVSNFQPSGPMSRLEEARPRAVRWAALTGPEQAQRDQSKGKAEGKSNMKGSGSTKQ